METIQCTIERVIFQNGDNGYSVFSVSVKDRMEKQTVVGTFPDIRVGTTIQADGEWKSGKYGMQFVAESWREVLPATVKGIQSYLASGIISGIGPKKAKAIVSHFGADTLSIISESPERLLEVPGIGRDRVRKITESWEKNRAVSDIMVFLQGHGISPAYAVRIYKEYRDDSIRKVRENPYALADDVFGIGFKMADQVAFDMGYEKNDLRRCKAGILYTLSQLANDGHCYAERSQLVKASAELLDVEDTYVKDALGPLEFDQSIIVENGDCYLPMYYYAECGVANNIKRLLDGRHSVPASVDMSVVSQKTGIEYDEVQEEAILQAVRSKVIVITGNPGCGKTTVVKGVIEAFHDKDVLLAAPTGRAAKRMSEATGRDAKTIHRLLEYNPKGGFTFNEKNRLRGDVLIVDEASMIDVLLMNSLLKALPGKMTLILVGDIDQLPSVGAGNILRDIIDSGAVPVVRLTKIFRQALTSRIVTNAHRINHGEMPDTSNGLDTDFFFIPQTDPEQAAKDIISIVKDRIPKAYGYGINDIQVLAPMKNGAVGTQNLNIILQQAINPDGEYIACGAYKYRVGDKVMQTRNNYDKNVFNGDVGTVVGVEDNILSVLYDKEPVDYEKGDMNELTLAYACTIHKSQGSEYPVVVMPIMMSHYVMLQRNLVYTGITRAKKICILIGDKKALALAVRNMTVLQRNTRLKERLNDK